MAATSSSTASTVPSRSSRACSFQEIETPSRHAKAAQLLWPLLLQTTNRIPCGRDEREEGNAGRGPGSTRRRAARPLPFGAHALVIARTTWPGQLSNDFGRFLPGWMHPSCHPPAQGHLTRSRCGAHPRCRARAARLAGAHALSVMCVRSGLLPKSYVPADRIAGPQQRRLSSSHWEDGLTRLAAWRNRERAAPAGVASEARSVQSAEATTDSESPCARDVVGWGRVRGTSAFLFYSLPLVLPAPTESTCRLQTPLCCAVPSCIDLCFATVQAHTHHAALRAVVSSLAPWP
jgi:hypothetical protein